MHTMQGHDNGPSAFGHSFTYISITTSPSFEILDQGSRWLINLLVIVILSKDEKIMGELLTDFHISLEPRCFLGRICQYSNLPTGNSTERQFLCSDSFCVSINRFVVI